MEMNPRLVNFIRLDPFAHTVDRCPFSLYRLASVVTWAVRTAWNSKAKQA